VSEHDESIGGFGQGFDSAESGLAAPETETAHEIETGIVPAGGADEVVASDQRPDDQPGSVADLDRIAQLPLGEQPAAYQHIHDDLQRALAQIDEA
jgi:hypothetical protein